MCHTALHNYKKQMEMEECCPQEGEFPKKTKGLCVPDLSLGKVEGLRVPRRERDLNRTAEGCLIMNQRNLKLLCQNDGLYQFPQMNKKIYLHYKVIEKISGLQKYINLKSLYLENNVIKKIQNLGQLTQLQNLFLQNNMISHIEGLQKLKELKVLNLANNTIFTISGLADCITLQSLTLAHNYLSDFGAVQHLGQCSTTLTSIDLSDNKIVPDERMFDLIQQVKLLYLSGNPLVRETNHYRRTVVAKLPNLMYLDQRGVDSEQKMLAVSWLNEGEAGYKAAKAKILQIRKEKKEEARKEIMANIDVHRRKKINVFEGNIIDSEKEIDTLRKYMREPGNEDQIYFYESRIADLMQKIRENQEFIDSIYKRMGFEPLPPVYSIELEPEQREEEPTPQEMREGGMFEIREAPEDRQQAQSEGQSQTNSEAASLESGQSGTPSQQSGASSRQESSSSQQSSLQTYYSYDELD